ncbi:MAG: hypothetical protein ACPL5F_07300 [Moorellaceae bacterium]
MSNAVVQVTQGTKKVVTIQRVREKLEERAAELALAFYRQIRYYEDAIWDSIEAHGSEKLRDIADRLTDVGVLNALLPHGFVPPPPAS